MREELGSCAAIAIFEKSLKSAAQLAHPIRTMSVQKFIAPDAAGAAEMCARRIFELLTAAIAARGRASLAVSGGSTPKLMFQQMAATPFDWERVHLFFVDERCVPPTDSASNYKLANDNLLAPAKIPAANVHRIAGELPPAERRGALHRRDPRFLRAAGRGDAAIRHHSSRHGAGCAHRQSFPRRPSDRRSCGNRRSDVRAEIQYVARDIAAGVLLAARNTVFLVAGADKVDALRAVFHEPYDPKKYPSQLGNDGESVAWYLDEKAKGDVF